MIPSPTIAGLLVEPKPFNFGLYFSTILALAPNPPVATITAFALIVYSLPSISLTFTPTILFLTFTNAIALVPFLISIFSFSAVLESADTIFGPTAAPPVGLWVLFALCPPVEVISDKSAPLSISQSTIALELLAKTLTNSLLFLFFPPFIVSS